MRYISIYYYSNQKNKQLTKIQYSTIQYNNTSNLQNQSAYTLTSVSELSSELSYYCLPFLRFLLFFNLFLSLLLPISYLFILLFYW
jgi:hypothetical protein